MTKTRLMSKIWRQDDRNLLKQLKPVYQNSQATQTGKEYNMVNTRQKEANITMENNQIMGQWKQRFDELTKSKTNISKGQEALSKSERNKSGKLHKN